MCGIFGDLSGKYFAEEKILKSLRLISHRGPDSLKIKIKSNFALGFTRLSIQDLSMLGDQPMSLEGDKVHIVFNGEIYNYKIIREELISLGIMFKSNSDTEVILKSYKQWGFDQTLKKLEGMFGLCIVDENLNKAFLARDRVGMKPLFYSVHNGNLIFSSEIKVILDYTNYRELDVFNSLNPIFMTGLSPRTKTMFKGVEQIEAGHSLEFDLETKKITETEYFFIGDLVDPDLYNEYKKYSINELTELYSSELDESIKLHLISDAPLASLFSAGLDSSVITASASKFTDSQLKLYYFESEMQKNDFHFAHHFSEIFNGDLKSVVGNDCDYLVKMPRMIYHYETINKEEGPVLGNLCRIARKDGIKVLLTGDGADEIFGGQAHHIDYYNQSNLHHNKIFNLLNRSINKYFPRSFTNYRFNDPKGISYFNFPPGIHFFEPMSNVLLHKGHRLSEWQRCIDTYSFIKNTSEREVRAYILDEIYYRLQRFMIRSDRFGMAESVEIRTPFLHPNILKLAVNTPPKFLFGPIGLFKQRYESKHLLRNIAKKKNVPKEIIYRKKIGTPYDTAPYTAKLLKNWPLTNLAETLQVDSKDLTNVATNSLAPDMDRTRFSLIASELLIRTLVLNESHENISEEIKKALH